MKPDIGNTDPALTTKDKGRIARLEGVLRYATYVADKSNPRYKHWRKDVDNILDIEKVFVLPEGTERENEGLNALSTWWNDNGSFYITDMVQEIFMSGYRTGYASGYIEGGTK